ncbi:MAG: trimeric intracellular cation channel family protein [Clostridia bacterium]|nr:trimeric intracellular cation channel family protein [Clostridia bacterium]
MSFSQIIFFAAELIGTAAFSIAGTLVAIRRELDIFGAVVVGTVTAVGGGCIRDILLGQFPPMMFKTPIYAALAAALAILVFILEYIITARKILESKTYETIVNVFDALGLAIFVVVGINTAATSGYGENAFLSICVGVLTGIGGGIIRDLFVGTIPMVLRKQVYALPAIIGGIIYYYMIYFSINEYIAVSVTLVFIMTVRILAAHFRWDLPKIKQK